MAIRVAALIGTFVVVNWWTGAVSHLSEESYSGSSVAREVLGRLWHVKTALPLVALLAVGFVRPLGIGWSELEHGRALKAFIGLTTAVLAWVFATYDYNFFFGESHTLDRFLLSGLAIVVLWKPVFVLPFVTLLVAMARQFYYPIGGYSVAQPSLLVRLLLLFVAAFFVLVASGRRKTTDFVFCALSLVAASYFSAGLGKIRLDWLSYGHVYHLIPTTYANGWLAFLEPATLSAIVRKVSLADWPLRVVAFFLECGALFFFWHRRLAIVLLGGWTAFHLAVFAFSGILFWMWMLVDLALLAFIWNGERAPWIRLFTWPRFVLSLVLIGGGSLWLSPVDLSWYDARTTYTYRFEATGESGRRYPLSPQFFAPYDYQFTMSSFRYLSTERRLPIVWGATFDREVAERLLACPTPAAILQLEKELGSPVFDEERASQLDDFIATFVANVAQRNGNRGWWNVVRAPAQLWSFLPTGAFWLEGDPIATVTVREVTSDWNGRELVILRDRVVREIDLR